MSKRKQRRKRRRKIGLIFLAAVLVFLLLPNKKSEVFSKGKEKISLGELYSEAAILLDEEGQILGRKNSEKKIYPASLTKIMTVLLSIEKLDNIREITVLREEIFPELYAQDASMAGFLPGEKVTYRDLLYGAMLPSGAECCVALAEGSCGSEKEFVSEMNKKAKKLGMKNTHFTNTTGLHDDNHYTTVEDLSRLLCYAMKNQDFSKIFTAFSYSVPATNKHPEGFTFFSTLSQELQKAGVKDSCILGGKTGYTSNAGLCLATAAEINGKKYFFITAHAQGSHNTEPYHVLDALSVYGKLEK